jgi:hypothetical protein
MTNVNQFKVGLESDKGYFTLKVKTMTLFVPAIVQARKNFVWDYLFVFL